MKTVSVLLLVTACGGGQSVVEAVDDRPTILAADPLETWNKSFTATGNGDWDTVRSTYHVDVTFVPASSGMKIHGRDKVVEFHKEFVDAFPDIESESYVTVSKGRTVASLSRTRGTNTASMGGMPPTGKTMSFVGLTLAEVNAEGQIRRLVTYADNLSFMAQLGAWKGPHRAADASPAPQATTVRAQGTLIEKANLEQVAAIAAAFNRGDGAGVASGYAKDAVLAAQFADRDAHGEAEIGLVFGGFFQAFPDAQIIDRRAWAAGEFVVVESVLRATHKAKWIRFPNTAAIGKQVSLELGELYRLRGGKVTQHWALADGMAMGTQLGAVDFSVPDVPRDPG